MKFKLIFISIFISVTLFGQRAIDGENFFNNKQYAKARAVYETLLKRRPNDPLYNYRCGRCCYELKDRESAIRYFELAGTKYSLRYLYLGELYFDNYQFDESVTAYQAYVSSLKPDDSKLDEYSKKITRSQLAAKLLSKVEDIVIVDSVLVQKNDFLQYYKYSRDLGTITQSTMKLANIKSVELVKYTTQRDDRTYFADSTHNQLDLFKSYKLLDGWTAKTPMSDVINSPANENYPFVMLDGVTVYFASDGENSLGGYDLFVTRFDPTNDAYLSPENIGMPFNSPFNDYMLVIDEQHKLGWFATDRQQVSGKVMIYTFIPNDTKQIIRTDDADYLRRVAQLKCYRTKTVKVPEFSQMQDDDPADSLEEEFRLVINDSIVYTHRSEFISEQALKLWGDYQKLSSELRQIKKELVELRERFATAETPDEKNEISDKVIALEKQYPVLERQISSTLIEARNAEIKFLEQ